MSTSSVAVLDQYRGRRMQRLRQSLALHSADPNRREVSSSLVEMMTACGADRIAAVYLDEFEGGRFHVYCVIDLACEVPRRTFDEELVRAAWSGGVPSLREDSIRSVERGSPSLPSSSLALTLGGDGARSWFIIADSVTPMSPLGPEVEDCLFFQAGRVAAALLHSDLAPTGDSGSVASGWLMLQDLQGREDDPAASRRIASRFVIARALRIVMEQTGEQDQLEAQAGIIRDELGALAEGDKERVLWEALIEALGKGDWVGLASGCLELGVEVDRQCHVSSTEELLGLAYDLSIRAGSISIATDATRYKARLFRRQSRWDKAEELYTYASDLARSAHDHQRHGLIISGLASVSRMRGDLPRARNLLKAQIQIAQAEGLKSVLAAAYHDLMAVEKLAGDYEEALINGWEAVSNHSDSEGMLMALVDLAGALTRLGHLTAAEDAYSIVAAKVSHRLYRVAALEGLANVAALKGDRSAFDQRIRESEEGGWHDLSTSATAEFMYHRGLSYRALGEAEQAAKWLALACERSDELNEKRTYFLAFSALEDLRAAVGKRTGPVTKSEPKATPYLGAARIGDQLRTMKEELLGV